MNSKICKDCANYKSRASGINVCIGSPDLSRIDGKPLELPVMEARYYSHYCGDDAKWFKEKVSLFERMKRILK